MIKLTFCLRRLPHLSREEFQRYWRENHAALVQDRIEALGMRRYVQLHSLPDELSAPLNARRGGPEPFDGIAEVWFDSYDAMVAAGSTPEGRKANRDLLEDERNFIDLSRSPIWISEEHVIIDRTR